MQYDHFYSIAQSPAFSEGLEDWADKACYYWKGATVAAKRAHDGSGPRWVYGRFEIQERADYRGLPPSGHWNPNG